MVVGALEVWGEGVVGDETVVIGQLHVTLVGLAIGLGPLVREDVVAVNIKRAWDVLVDLNEVAISVNAVETVEVALELGGVEGVDQLVGCQDVDLDVDNAVALEIELVDLLSDVTDLFA